MLVIVEQKSLSDFAGGVPNNGVGICVVCRRPIENLDAQSPLLQEIRLSVQGVLDNVLEQGRVSFAVGELWTGQNFLQLAQDRVAILH